jgi:hypothetical protein
MLIEKSGYRRNGRGEIIKREIVEIKCDKCGKEWETIYDSRKKKILALDLCINCRAKRAWSKTSKTINHKKVEISCDNCNKMFKRKPSKITGLKHHFCSRDCKAEYFISQRYGQLEKNFTKNQNEVSYLFGLILGDGHLKKCGKERTTNIFISFDSSSKWMELLEIAKKVLDKIKINWHIKKVKYSNCIVISFILPDYILEKYISLYSGNKFEAQPLPKSYIMQNINYAAGLLNSDGYVYFNRKKNIIGYGFSNTVASIENSLHKCLSFNGVGYTKSTRFGRLDKRTGNTNKNEMRTYIGETGKDKLHKLCSFMLKGNMEDTI